MAAASAALPVNTDMSFSGWWQGLVAGLLTALILGALQRFGFVAFNGPANVMSALFDLAAVDEFLRIPVVHAGRSEVALAPRDRQRVVAGKSGLVGVCSGGCGINKKNK